MLIKVRPPGGESKYVSFLVHRLAYNGDVVAFRPCGVGVSVYPVPACPP
jgi:hypothetical protein